MELQKLVEMIKKEWNNPVRAIIEQETDKFLKKGGRIKKLIVENTTRILDESEDESFEFLAN